MPILRGKKISNNLTLYLKKLETNKQKEQTKPKVKRRKKIKIGTEIHEIETKKTKKRSVRLRVSFLK